jgi:hypothetical protein
VLIARIVSCVSHLLQPNHLPSLPPEILSSLGINANPRWYAQSGAVASTQRRQSFEGKYHVLTDPADASRICPRPCGPRDLALCPRLLERPGTHQPSSGRPPPRHDQWRHAALVPASAIHVSLAGVGGGLGCGGGLQGGGFGGGFGGFGGGFGGIGGGLGVGGFGGFNGFGGFGGGFQGGLGGFGGGLAGFGGGLGGIGGFNGIRGFGGFNGFGGGIAGGFGGGGFGGFAGKGLGGFNGRKAL